MLLAGCTDCLENTFLPFRLTQTKSGPTRGARRRSGIRATFCFLDVITLSPLHIHWLHDLCRKLLFPHFHVAMFWSEGCGQRPPSAVGAETPPPSGQKSKRITSHFSLTACNQNCCLIKAGKSVLHAFLLIFIWKEIVITQSGGRCPCSQPQEIQTCYLHAVHFIFVLQKQE